MQSNHVHNNAPVQIKVRIGSQGRVVIPSTIRRALGLREGETPIAQAEDGRLVLETRRHILKLLQEHFAEIASEISLADELVAERHEEATFSLSPHDKTHLDQSSDTLLPRDYRQFTHASTKTDSTRSSGTGSPSSSKTSI